MLMIMLLALFRASQACLDAQLANLLNVRAFAGHGLSRKRANIRTLSIECNTIAKHGQFVFFQAGYIAYIASVHTLETCFDAFFIFEFI
jgi:hypothetical protein